METATPSLNAAYSQALYLLWPVRCPLSQMKAKAILNIIESGMSSALMSFNNDEWRMRVPSTPGWYFIETNTPPEEFKNVGPPKGQRHYDIPKKVSQSLEMNEYDFCILPSNNQYYFVYSGEAKNLKARAKEHMSGHPNTGCLALSNYKSLHAYTWKFYFALCPNYKDPNETKLLRTIGEQAWRSKYGWPILCGK